MSKEFLNKWELQFGRDEVLPSFVIASADKRGIAMLPMDEEAKDLMLANAHLIAAAPELLEMVKQCRAVYGRWLLGVDDSYSDLDELIAKAEGPKT